WKLAMVNMHSLRSKEDDVEKISSSVFVTNFPEQFSAKDLWNTCKVYEHVVDTYIPDRRSKIGKRFGFVRFINVFDIERLVNNLCTVWIGKLKLHANVARYQRDSGKNNYQSVVKKPTGVKETIDSTPTMVLDESCLNNEEFSLCLLGKVTEFASLTNLKVVLAKEGFGNIELKYMGGFWRRELYGLKLRGFYVNGGRKNTFNRIASRWGNLLNAEELEEGGYHSNRLCIQTKINMAVVESFKMVYCGKTCWVRAIEVPGWVLDFKDDCDVDDFESNDGTHVAEGHGESVGKCSDLEGESDSEAIPETRFKDEPMDKVDDINSIPHSKPRSKDPFGVYELLNKKKKVTNNECESQNSPTYPPGFTPNDNVEENINTSNVEPIERGHNGDKEKGDEAVGQSGGILSVLDPNKFQKLNHTLSDYCTLVRGVWVPNGTNLLIISIYAPLELSEKRTLWDYLLFTICNWDGGVVTMGDFNEVRDSSERFGSVFNKHGVKLFNDFIDKAGLTKVPLAGCIFTWCHKTASKISKFDRFLVSDSLLCNCPRISSVTLDRYLSDHRPILLRESIYDYGPIPFKFYHYWFEIDGFDKLVDDSWNEIHVVDNNAYMRFIKKLKLLKERIKAWNSSYRELTNCRKNTLKTS
nr:nucleotide-binding alpha-beta plait domain-containing protein [Tanacetum cinerariifolium]